MQSWSSTSISELNPQIKKAYPRRRNMMTIKCRKMWVWLDGFRETLLGDHDKITNKSSSWRVSCRWEWSCNSMKICKSQLKWKYAPIWNQIWNKLKIGQHHIVHHQMCDLCHPRPRLNQTQTSRRRLPEEEAWWYLNAEKCGSTWMAQKRLNWGDHDKITIYYQLVIHPVSGEDHVTPWRSTNLNRKGNMPQYGIDVW